MTNEGSHMQNVLGEMLKLLSDEDKVVFNSLAEKLKSIDGDITRLSEEEKALIQAMELKYGEKINQAQQYQSAPQATAPQLSVDLLEMPFAVHVRQILARDLGEQIPEEEAAIQFAFDHKWLPVECQDDSLVEEVFTRFETDICEINQWRENLVGIESDKKLAVGLAWFMVVYQLQQQFNSNAE